MVDCSNTKDKYSTSRADLAADFSKNTAQLPIKCPYEQTDLLLRKVVIRMR